MPITVRELAELVQGRLHGDGDLAISDARSLSEAAVGHITFAENEHQARHLATSRASAAVVPESLPVNGLTLIRVGDPLAAFIAIVERVRRQNPATAPGIDPRAAIHPSAIIGPDASIHPFACVGEGAVLGPAAAFTRRRRRPPLPARR